MLRYEIRTEQWNSTDSNQCCITLTLFIIYTTRYIQYYFCVISKLTILDRLIFASFGCFDVERYYLYNESYFNIHCPWYLK